MAKEVLTDVAVNIAGSDFSNPFKTAEISGDVDQFETTGFGDTHKTYLPGFKNWSVTLTFNDDFADNGLNENLFDWWGTTQPIKLRKASGAISATNPEFRGDVIFQQVPLLGADLAAVSGGSITLQGTGTLSRVVA